MGRTWYLWIWCWEFWGHPCLLAFFFSLHYVGSYQLWAWGCWEAWDSRSEIWEKQKFRTSIIEERGVGEFIWERQDCQVSPKPCWRSVIMNLYVGSNMIVCEALCRRQFYGAWALEPEKPGLCDIFSCYWVSPTLICTMRRVICIL